MPTIKTTWSWIHGRLPSLLLFVACSDAAGQEVSRRSAEPRPGSAADVLLFSDFEQDDWWQVWGARSRPENTSLVAGAATHSDQGKSLRVEVPRGSTTGANFHFRFRDQTGMEPEEIYIGYDLKLDPDWKYAIDGGKLPGFSGTYGRAGWGGRKVTGSEGWSARGSFRRPREESTTIGFYCYHADMRTNYGDIWDFQPPLKYDTWYRVEMYCKLNTPGRGPQPGQSDGVLRGWIDGRLALEKTGIRFRHVETLRIESVWVNVYHGGTRPAPRALHLYLDNFVISRKPIGKAP